MRPVPQGGKDKFSEGGVFMKRKRLKIKTPVQNLGSNPIKVSFLAKSKTTVQITALSFLIVSPNFEETFFKFTVFF